MVQKVVGTRSTAQVRNYAESVFGKSSDNSTVTGTNSQQANSSEINSNPTVTNYTNKSNIAIAANYTKRNAAIMAGETYDQKYIEKREALSSLYLIEHVVKLLKRKREELIQQVQDNTTDLAPVRVVDNMTSTNNSDEKK